MLKDLLNKLNNKEELQDFYKSAARDKSTPPVKHDKDGNKLVVCRDCRKDPDHCVCNL